MIEKYGIFQLRTVYLRDFKMTQQPHDNGARYYDFVYQQTFGNSYKQFCKDTENVCSPLIEHCPADGYHANILDVGAGTGRVTIPLLQQGCRVTAVEPSISMCNELRRKAEAENLTQNLTIEQKLIQRIESSEDSFDIALCVFTVIAYIVQENNLRQAIQNIASSLKRDGLFLLEIPQQDLFQSVTIRKQGVTKEVTITPSTQIDGLYQYKEICNGMMDGNPFEYKEEFPIKQWEDENILKICNENGLVQSELQKEILEYKFCGTGGKYYLLKKR